jgi:hypothetical protein
MAISAADREVLRELAERTAEVAALPVHQETADEWRRLNGLRRGRPMVWINEIPWHEMNVNDELTLRCSDPLTRDAEWGLRTQLYQWEHLRADMVVEPVFYSQLVIHDTGFGIEERSELIPQDERGGILSHGFHPQITCEADISKIRTPVLTHDVPASEANLRVLADAFGDILPVVPCGVVTYWFAPWDELVRWWGVTEALTDLIERPSLVHLAMERLTNAYLARLRQWQDLHVLSVTPGNYRVGSGGLGFTDDLPQPPLDEALPSSSRAGTETRPYRPPDVPTNQSSWAGTETRPYPPPVLPVHQWGCATAQIFGSVSPEMHEEFALQYERRWLSQFGLTYYGCCEPLHDKLGLMATIPNLRKISMSPWADLARAASLVGGKYVFSHKPNPAIFATDTWNPASARAAIVSAIEQAGGHPLEIIMKDISTVRNEPHRLWEWASIAADVVSRFG